MENWEKVKDEIWAMFRENAKRQEESAKRQEERAKRQEEEIAKWQEENAKRQEEYAKRQEEYAKWQEEEEKKHAEWKKESDRQAAERKAEYDRQAAEYKKEAAERKAEADRRSAEYDKKMDELREQTRKTNEMVNGIGRSNGLVAEETYYNTLAESKTLGNIHFDEIEQNWRSSLKLKDKTKIKGQFDIIMINDVAIGLIEIKYKVRPGDIANLAGNQVNAFKTLFPAYADYKFYLGIGGLCYDKGKENDEKFIEDEAKEYGVAILKVKGDVVEIDDKNLKVY